MKIFLFIAIVLSSQLAAFSQATPKETNSTPASLEATKKKLADKYDINRNGKIDIQERKPYVRELARLQREEQQRLVEAEARAPRIDGVPASWDTNGDGKVDAEERREGLNNRRPHFVEKRVSSHANPGTNLPSAPKSTP